MHNACACGSPRDWLVYARAGVYLTCASLYCTFIPISPSAAIAHAVGKVLRLYGICRVFKSRGGIITFLLPAGLSVAQPCRYCSYSEVQKWVFRPAGATRCPDKREIWHGGANRSRVRNFTFIGAEMWEYSPQNCQNFESWPEICTSGATRLQYFCEIIRICTRYIGTF